MDAKVFRIIAALGTALMLCVPTALLLPIAQATVATKTAVSVLDPQDMLTDQDEALLATETEKLGLPESVQTVTYVVFRSNDENLNDTVEREIRASKPELIADNNDAWTPGALIIAYGAEPRQNGAYCGDDLCTQFRLFEGRHLDGTLEAMRPALKKGNITVGLLEGARYAVDADAIAADKVQDEKDAENGKWLLYGFLGFLGIGTVGVGAVAMRSVRRSRQRRTQQALEDQKFVLQHYGEIAHRLDQIDIRANSLTSELANDELRAQWQEVRDRFVKLHETVDQFTVPTYRNAASYAEARTTVEHLRQAEKNIDSLWEMEHGDEQRRRRELVRLYDDIVRAQAKVRSTHVRNRLHAVEDRITALKDNTAAPDFMDQYVGIIHDYGLALDLVRDQELRKVKTTYHAPKLYEPDYQIGTGYGSYIPFAVVYTQYNSAVSAAAAASASSSSSYSANTSFSSGFSGGGGSGSF